MNKLIQCNDEEYKGKAYLVDRGRRRWFQDASIVEKLGYKFSEDISIVEASELRKIPLGPNLPITPFIEKVSFKNIKSMQEAREKTVSFARGEGVEFGAAANPLPIPLGSSVRYADLFTHDQLVSELYEEGKDYEFVPTDILCSFDDMIGLEDNSVDFIIASHVIEHVRNPIKSIENAWNKLRSKGTLILIIPKKERTFDRGRELTTLSHLVEDYKNPSKYRDLLHIADYYANAKPIDIKELYVKLNESLVKDHHSVHYHVWNENSFSDFIEFVQKSFAWKVILNEPALKGDENYEFYVVLQKP